MTGINECEVAHAKDGNGRVIVFHDANRRDDTCSCGAFERNDRARPTAREQGA